MVSIQLLGCYSGTDRDKLPLDLFDLENGLLGVLFDLGDGIFEETDFQQLRQRLLVKLVQLDWLWPLGCLQAFF